MASQQHMHDTVPRKILKTYDRFLLATVVWHKVYAVEQHMGACSSRDELIFGVVAAVQAYRLAQLKLCIIYC